MRIIGGSAGGRRLRAPAGATTRPTSDRVREAVFSILGPPPEDARVLDLFAGSGGMGLEALSRGAGHACFAERDNGALQALRHNIQDLGMGSSTAVHRGEALRYLNRLAGEGTCFHWIFLDPPYATELGERALEAIGAGELLCPQGTAVLEHDRRRLPSDQYGCLVQTDSRRYGDTCVSFYERNLHE